MVAVPSALGSMTLTWLVESVPDKRPVEVARALVNPVDSSIPLRLLNSHTDLIELGKGKVIAVLEPVIQDQFPEMISPVAERTEPTMKKRKQLRQMALETGDAHTVDEQQQLFLVLLECLCRTVR